MYNGWTESEDAVHERWQRTLATGWAHEVFSLPAYEDEIEMLTACLDMCKEESHIRKADLYQQWEQAEKEYHRNPTVENRVRAMRLWKARNPNASPYRFS